MTRYPSEKIDDPRQVDLEEYIRNKGGYTPGPRQAVAFGTDGDVLGRSIPMKDAGYTTVREMYAPLRNVLDAAYEQASAGKGKERHANDKSFLSQPIMEIARMHGLGFVTGQAAKKSQEAVGMVGRDEYAAAQRELLGAIVYLAAAYIRVTEVSMEKSVDDRSQGG